jgi:Tfp pilus assembly protein PilV
MNRKLRHFSRRGFTLVEAMVAAAVVIMGIVGMIQVVTSGSEMLDTAHKQTIAAQVIHGQIDYLRGQDWSVVSALGNVTSVAVDAGNSNGFVFGTNIPTVAKGFTVSRTVAAVSGRTDMKQFTFTIQWTGNTGRTHTRSGSAYFAKNGLYVTYQR